MNSHEKTNLFTTYTSFAKTFFYIATFLLLTFGVVGQIVFPDERDILNTNCRPFETTWFQVLENGDTVAVEVPGKVQAEYGEIVTLTTTLPEDIHYGECLCFRPIWQDITVYIDGELRVNYSTIDSRPFGINSPMRYIFVELQEADAGKELTYQFSSNSKYAGDMRTSYIGDRFSIWMHLLNDSGVHTVITIFLLFMSIFCIVICSYLRIAFKNPLPLNHLAWTIFFCALWMLSEVAFRQILFSNISLLSCYAYWSLIIIPLPLLLFINEMQNGRYQKVFFIPIVFSVLMLIVGTFLQVFDIVQFVKQLPFIHGGLLVSILCIIVTITIDVFKKQISDYLFVGIGVYGLLLTAVIEMILYYVGRNYSLGTVLAIGLLFLLVMAIIKTGQDLLRSEKKKQEAIVAREAQAKFLANMSHEIRTPINAIIGMNEMILRESENESIQGYATNIQSASNMLLGLINDVLDFSKIESGQFELIEDTYSLSSLIQDEMLLLKARAMEKPISIQYDIDPQLPSILWGDELRIKQILTNLISNAVKYTNEGGITLKAFFKQLDDDTIELCFSVIDTGIGIQEEDLSKLFDSFKRLELNKNRTIQGTGLGLNIAKQLIDLMHGTITVTSTYGKGSTFTVAIPQRIIDKQPINHLESIAEKQIHDTSLSKDVFTAPNAAVLVVDDNTMNLTLMKELLKRTKIQVDLASSGKECLKLTKEKTYNIILMDHMMPEMDGVETLHMLRADNTNPNQDTIVIAVTANAIAGCREQYLDYGFNDYFSKPVQANRLDELLLKYLPKELVSTDSMPKQPIINDAVVTDTPVAPPQDASMDLLEIDKKTGLMYCLDSESFYNEMLTDYCVQAQDYLGQLEDFFQNRDWKNYAILTHSLKTSSLNIGACNFSKLSLQHELAGNEENSDFIEAEYTHYIATLKDLIKKIEAMKA